MKCPNCNSGNIKDISDISHQIYLCKICSYFWINIRQDVQTVEKIDEKQ